jgi:serine/threonine-protein kinase
MPFYSENPGDLMLMIMTTEAKLLADRVPDVGTALSEVVARAMNKRPEDRYQSVREMQKSVLAASQEVLGSAAVERLNTRLRPSSWRTENPQVETHSEAPPRRRAMADTELTHRGEVPKVRKASGRKWMLPAAGAAVAAVVIGLGAIWFGRSSADPAPRFIVVRSEPAAPVAAAAVGATPVTTPLTPSPAGQLNAKVQESSARSKPGVPPAARTTAELLAESFRRQRAPVVACLNAHAAEAEVVPKLAVKFALSSEGRVERAGVSPAELSQTPMGSCIESAVRAMSFPPQAQPISFEVPLTARKGT